MKGTRRATPELKVDSAIFAENKHNFLLLLAVGLKRSIYYFIVQWFLSIGHPLVLRSWVKRMTGPE